jgi:hypothetical protein
VPGQKRKSPEAKRPLAAQKDGLNKLKKAPSGFEPLYAALQAAA